MRTTPEKLNLCPVVAYFSGIDIAHPETSINALGIDPASLACNLGCLVTDEAITSPSFVCVPVTDCKRLNGELQNPLQ